MTRTTKALLLPFIAALLGGCREPPPAPELNGVAVRSGTTFHLADERGKVVLLSFGYTSCLDICPTTFAVAKGVLDHVGRDVDFVYVTVDPERDRPDVLGPFLRNVDTRFEGIVAEGDALRTMLDGYHVTTRKRLPNATGAYAMDHTAGFWGIDRRGRLRFHLEHDAPASEVESATRALVDEAPPGRVHVENAVGELAPTGTGAVYLDLVNDAGEADRLERVESGAGTEAELHEMVKRGGVTSMRTLDGIDLPARGAAHLARGAQHIMLSGLHGASEVPLTFHFSRAPALTVKIPVRPLGMSDKRKLRVCSDPNNLPFSNSHEEGFENELAKIVAGELKANVEYTWAPQRRGFVRTNLKAKKCDVVMGVPTAVDMLATTKPYYRSSYVFVTPPSKPIRSLDDPALKSMKIGVSLVGDDGANPPAALALAAHDLVNNLRGYSVFGDYREESPPADLIRAVRKGEVDIALAWGPLAGWYSKPDLTIAPMPESEAPEGMSFQFDIALGVRKGEKEFAAELDGVLERRKPDIDALLDRFNVPRTAR